MTLDTAPDEVVAAWVDPGQWHLRRIGSGLINDTFLLVGPDERKLILQRLHPVFAAEVNEDIDAITRHLAERGMTTPRLVPTRSGRRWVTHENRTWRVLTHISGHSVDYVDSKARAQAAGFLVGRFHRLMADLRYDYQSRRPGVHDTPRHLDNLRSAVEAHGSHALHASVAPLAEALLREADTLADLSALPERHSHGDLKISNLLFDAAGDGICLIDLDTLALMRWPLEMGDALRSWCNPGTEDRHGARVDLELLSAALSGYARASGDFLTSAEKALLADGLIQICLELAGRFAADALQESYFAWDPANYATRGEHNLARALAMRDLLADVRSKEEQIRAVIRDRLG